MCAAFSVVLYRGMSCGKGIICAFSTKSGEKELIPVMKRRMSRSVIQLSLQC